MTSELPDPEIFELAMVAFRTAIVRVTESSVPLAARMYAPLTEASWWAICVDEELEKSEGYKSRRNTDAQGRVVQGLRYARSALGHHQFFAVTHGGGLSVPFKIPFQIEAFPAWPPVEHLPVFTEQATVKPFYENWVAGRRVLDTLHDAVSWFDRAKVEFRFHT